MEQKTTWQSTSSSVKIHESIAGRNALGVFQKNLKKVLEQYMTSEKTSTFFLVIRETKKTSTFTVKKSELFLLIRLRVFWAKKHFFYIFSLKQSQINPIF